MSENYGKIDPLLKMTVENGGSDLHLKVGSTPHMRKNSKLIPLDSSLPKLSLKDAQAMISPILTGIHRKIFLEKKQVDMAYSVPQLGRFRLNIFLQRRSLRLVARCISSGIPTFESLNLNPRYFEKLCLESKRGLILITGATGAGKTSTSIAMLDYINKHQHKHILTIEDPIEFLLKDKKSFISQREMGSDYFSFAEAFKAALRQDPDIIFFGELRGKDVIENALIAADTGHLVIGTCHTIDAAETINRLLSVFDKEEAQMRSLLASCFKSCD